jgi:tetratricopeptide (TPR) repeat protein
MRSDSFPTGGPEVAGMRRRPASRRREVLFGLFVAVLGAAVYLNTLGNELVQDDAELIPGNALMRDPWAAGDILTGRYWGELRNSAHYRPLAVWSIALDHWTNERLGRDGTDVRIFHGTNVLLHAAAGAVVFALFVVLGLPAFAAVSASAIFAVMPIHTEAVAPISGRAEPLALLWGCLFLILHRRAGPWAALPALALALLGKESGIAFIAVAVWMDLCLPARSRGTGLRRLRPGAYAAYAGLAALWLVLRARALAGGSDPITFLDNPLATAGTAERVLTALRVQLDYVVLQLVPWRLSSDYSFDAIPLVRSPFHPSVLGFLGLAAAAAVLAWRWRTRHPVVAFAVGAYACLAAPTANIVFPAVSIMAERVTYAPSMLAALLIGAAVARLGVRAPRITVLAVAGVAMAYAAVTVTRNASWANEAVFYAAQLRAFPRNAKASYNVGLVHQERGELDAAEERYHAALAVYPEYWSAWNNLGRLHASRGRHEDAIAAYDGAIAAWPAYAVARYNRALSLIQLRRFPEAAAALESLLALDPRHDRGLGTLGGVYLQLGRFAEAAAALERAVARNPRDVAVLTNLGGAYLGLGRRADAKAAWERALAVEPGFAPAREGLSRLTQSTP